MNGSPFRNGVLLTVDFYRKSLKWYVKEELLTVLMKDCPYKLPEKIFKENDIYSMKKVVGSAHELSAKYFSHWTSTY